VTLWPRYAFTMSLRLWNLISYIFYQSLLVPSVLQNACRRNGCSCRYANPQNNFFSRHICSTCNFVIWLRSFTACLWFKSPFREQRYDDSTSQRGIRSLSTWPYNPLMKTLTKSSEGLFHFIRTDESKCSRFFSLILGIAETWPNNPDTGHRGNLA